MSNYITSENLFIEEITYMIIPEEQMAKNISVNCDPTCVPKCSPSCRPCFPFDKCNPDLFGS